MLPSAATIMIRRAVRTDGPQASPGLMVAIAVLRPILNGVPPISQDYFAVMAVFLFNTCNFTFQMKQRRKSFGIQLANIPDSTSNGAQLKAKITVSAKQQCCRMPTMTPA
jgi:hypothetical protein